MATVTPQRATIDDLLKTEGKAELIGGRIVPLMPTGRKPNRAAGRIYSSLDAHDEATGRGEAYTDNMGFAIPELPSRRESFSPDASYYDGPFPADSMRFIVGPPTFAVEVRGKTDSGRAHNHVDSSGTTFRLSTESWKAQSCPCLRDSTEARVRTGVDLG